MKSIKEAPFKSDTSLPWAEGQILYSDLEANLEKVLKLDHLLPRGIYGLVIRTRDTLYGLGLKSGIPPGTYRSDNALDLVAKHHSLSRYLLGLMFEYSYRLGTQYPTLGLKLVNSYLTLPEVQNLAPALDIVQEVISEKGFRPLDFLKVMTQTDSAVSFGKLGVDGDSMGAFTFNRKVNYAISSSIGPIHDQLGGVWLCLEGSELSGLWEKVLKTPIPIGVSFGSDDEKRLLMTFKLLIDTNPDQTRLLFGRNSTAERIRDGIDLRRVTYTVTNEAISYNEADFRYVDELVIPTSSIRRIMLPLAFTENNMYAWTASNQITDALGSGPIPYDLAYQFCKGAF